MSEAGAFERVVEQERADARRRRWKRSRRVLRIHAWIFAAVNAGMIVAWLTLGLMTDDSHPAWWLPTTAGWGVGLAIHAAAVFRPWRQRRSEVTGTE